MRGRELPIAHCRLPNGKKQRRREGATLARRKWVRFCTFEGGRGAGAWTRMANGGWNPGAGECRCAPEAKDDGVPRGEPGKTRVCELSGAGDFHTPRSPRPGHEPLDSSGAYHPVASWHDSDLPMRKQHRLRLRQAAQPPGGGPPTASESLVGSPCPANQPAVEAAEGSPQGGGIVPTVIVDPSTDARVELPGQLEQLLLASSLDVPAPDFSSHGLCGLAADGREIAGKQLPAAPVLRRSRSEAVTEEVELDVLVLLTPSAVPAVHDACLFGMRFQLAVTQTLLDRSLDLLRLGLGSTVDHDVVRIALERAVGVLPAHPRVERMVQEDIGQ